MGAAAEAAAPAAASHDPLCRHGRIKRSEAGVARSQPADVLSDARHR